MLEEENVSKALSCSRSSSLSNLCSISSLDTNSATVLLTNTMFELPECHEFEAYFLDLEWTRGWVLCNKLSDVLYLGGIGAQTRTIHEIKNYMNTLGRPLVSFIS